MKTSFIYLLTLFFGFTSFAQEIYSAKKGARFFPGHFHVVINVDSTELQYQVFNHWYAHSYAQDRDVNIPINELNQYGVQNDTLTIILLKNKVKLIDKKCNLRQTVKHQKICTSVDSMRKISYAVSIAQLYENIRHFQLYDRTDLALSEEEFKLLVNQNLERTLKQE